MVRRSAEQRLLDRKIALSRLTSALDAFEDFLPLAAAGRPPAILLRAREALSRLEEELAEDEQRLRRRTPRR
jgi:hypothetical protein